MTAAPAPDPAGTSRAVDPPGIAPPAARYAHGVVSTGPGRWLHSCGVVPIAPDGSVPEDIGAQAAVVWANIEAILTEADMEISDIVRVTTWVVADEVDLGPVMAARDAVMGDHLAASVLLTAPRLAQPSWRVEIAVEAFSS